MTSADSRYNGIDVSNVVVAITDNDLPLIDPVFNTPSSNPFGLTDVGSNASPTLVDIDDDGDLDAFVGNLHGDMLFYRNTGTADSPAFDISISNPFGLTDVGANAKPTFADIDGDGDLDAFVGDDFGEMLFYRNIGTADSPAFDAASSNPFGLTYGRHGASSPTFADIDGDGDLDAFVGDVGDTLFYLNIGTVNSPAFDAASTNPFGLTNVGSFANPTFADIDGDGDLDAFVDNYDGNIFYRNTGTTNSPFFDAPSTNPFGLTNVGYQASPTFADIDGDGDLDAFVGNKDGNIVFFRNKVISPINIVQIGGSTAVSEGGATDTYTVALNNAPSADVTISLNTTNNQVICNINSLTFTATNWAVPQTVTVTAIDDTVGEGKHTGVIQHTVISADSRYDGIDVRNVVVAITDNDLPLTDPVFNTESINPFGLTDVGNDASPTFVDIDGDGDLDAFVSNSDGNTLFYRNTGTAYSPIFATSSTNPFGLTNVGQGASPTFADIDGDGDLDAFMGASWGYNMLFYRNSGTPNNPVFDTASIYPFGLTAPGYGASPTFADIDGDGDLDAFVCNGAGDVLFFRNTGTADSPAFDTSISNPFGLTNVGAYASPTFADIDSDGDLDAFVGSNDGNALFYRNTGTASSPAFDIPSTNPFGLTNVGYGASPTLVDIDGDGDLDAFVGNQHGTIAFYLNNIAPTLIAFSSVVASGNEDSEVTVSFTALQSQGNETDADGTVEAFVVKVVSSGTLKIGLSAATATAWNATTNNTVDATHQAYWTPATNANGTLNAFTAVAKDDRGTESVTPVQTQVNVTALSDVSISAGTNPVEGGITGTFTITLESPAPAGGLTVNYSAGGTATSNTDYMLTAGSNIVALTNSSFTIAAGQTFATLAVNATTDGVFDPNETINLNLTVGTGYQLVSNVATFAPKVDYATHFSDSINVGDFNGDGKLDLAVNDGFDNNIISVLLRNADNTGFDAKVDYLDAVGGATPHSITVGDFNNDGKLDLAAANYGAGTISVLLRNTDNTGFNTNIDYTTGMSGGVQSNSVSAGDFNNDGKLDLAIINFNNNTVSILLRNATNTGFDAKIDYATGSYPYSVSSGDFNNDGKLDLAIISGNMISVLLRNTDNTGFDAKVDVTTGWGALSVGDFNGDGKLDLAVANYSDNTISVLLRNAANTGFDTKVDYVTGKTPYSVSVGDFNNDGKDDLAVANSGNNTVSVLLRNTDNTGFDTKVDYATGKTPQSVSIGDFNNDGKTDLAIANVYSDSVSVLLNNSISSTARLTIADISPPTGTASAILTDGKEDKAYTVSTTNLLHGLSDVNGDSLSISNLLTNHGTVVSNTNGTFTITPTPDYNGTVNLTYDVTDGKGGSIAATQSFTLAAVNDAPSLSSFGTVTSGNEDTEMAITFANLQTQGNGTDIDGTVTAFVVKAVSSGKLKIGLSAATATAWNAKTNNTVDATHTAYWTPATNANGTLNAFTVTAKDNSGATSVTPVQAQVSVTAVNDAPVLTAPKTIKYTDTVFDDSFATLTGKLAASDIEGKPLSYGISDGTDNGNGTISQTGTYGVLTVTKTTGAYSFAPNDAAIEALAVNANANFSVTASDGSLSNTKTLAINITQKGTTESVGNDTLTGTSANNKFDGLAGNDIINGLTGADIMTGGLGNDTYVVDNKGDVVTETSTLATEIDSVNSSVSYTLGANVENLTLAGTAAINGTGNGLANTLIGNTAKNLLIGNAGNDILDGGTGNDVLTGGEGLDVFRFTTAPTANRDTITDFSVADDTIQLENGIFSSLGKTGALKAANFVKAAAAVDANDYIVYNPATGALLYDADGSGANAAQQIALLGVNLALTSADFGII